MKLSFSTLGCPDWDVWQVAEKAKEYGFDAVELRTRDDKHVYPTLTKEQRREIAAHYQKNGVEIACLAGYASFNVKDKAILEQRKQQLLDQLDLAVDLHAKYVRAFIGQGLNGLTEAEVVEIASEYLNICGAVAEQKRVQILLETHSTFGTGKKVSPVLQNMQNNAVGVIWDFGHSVSQGETLEETYALLGDSIKHVHTKDMHIGKDGKHESCLVGKGSLPLREFIVLLQSNGFSGCYSLEWEKWWEPALEDPEIAFPYYVNYMRNL